MTPIAQNIEKAVFTKYYVEFNEIFSKLFKDLIEDNEIEVRLNELFSIIVEQNGFDIDVKNLSGGEKSSLAIAYRLGLKQIIENNLHGETKLDILILDEPTDGFSNEQVDRLGNILKNSDLKQTILVSHDEKIESISDRTIKIEKINHVSKVL
jgi:exonuclease SbcC